MKILNVEKKNNIMYFDVEIDSNIWKKHNQVSFNQITKNIKLPGFRKGFVPKEIIKSKISNMEIYQKSLSLLNQQINSFILDSKDFNQDLILDKPFKSLIKKIDDNTCVVSVGFETVPIISNFSLSDVKLTKKDSNNIDENMIDKQIKNIVKSKSKFINNIEEIRNGDIVNIDFIGFIDNVKFPGGEAKDFDLEIGSKSFIDNFEDQLIGKKINTEVDVKVNFPTDYFKKELADKPALFKVKINNIKRYDFESLDENFFKDLKIKNVDSIETLKNYLINLNKKEQKNVLINDAAKELNELIIKKAKINYYSETLLQVYEQQLLNEYKKQANNQKLNWNDFLKKNNVNEAQFKVFLENASKNNLLIALTYERLIKELKIEVSNQDIKTHINNLSLYLGDQTKAEIAYENNKDFYDALILKDKLLEKLISFEK